MPRQLPAPDDCRPHPPQPQAPHCQKGNTGAHSRDRDANTCSSPLTAGSSLTGYPFKNIPGWHSRQVVTDKSSLFLLQYLHDSFLCGSRPHFLLRRLR
ncbi:unnamed protein product [Lota lota]